VAQKVSAFCVASASSPVSASSIIRQMTPKLARSALAFAMAAIASAADPPQPVAVIPARLNANNQFFIQARIDDAEPMTCHVDSGGGDRIYLDRNRALKMGIRPTGTGLSASPNMTAMAQDLRSRVTLEVAGLKFADQPALLQSRPSAEFSCVIGQTVFQRYIVEVDYGTPAFRLYDPARFQYDGPGKTVPITMQAGNPVVDTAIITVGGRALTPRLSVDTGCGTGLAMLSKTYIDRNDVMSGIRDASPDRRYGSAGQQPRVVAAEFEKLAVGDFDVARPVLSLWQIAGFGGADGPDGLLCGDFLRRFRLIFDYDRKALTLEPVSRGTGVIL
jgi:hypothetical protein